MGLVGRSHSLGVVVVLLGVVAVGSVDRAICRLYFGHGSWGTPGC